MKNIQLTFPSRGGNTISVNYNSENGALFIDLIASNGKGGTELFRRMLQEKTLLKHTEECQKETVVKQHPETWAEEFGIEIIDRDGWITPAKDYHTSITATEFIERANASTIRIVDSEKYRKLEKIDGNRA